MWPRSCLGSDKWSDYSDWIWGKENYVTRIPQNLLFFFFFSFFQCLDRGEIVSSVIGWFGTLLYTCSLRDYVTENKLVLFQFDHRHPPLDLFLECIQLIPMQDFHVLSAPMNLLAFNIIHDGSIDPLRTSACSWCCIGALRPCEVWLQTVVNCITSTTTGFLLLLDLRTNRQREQIHVSIYLMSRHVDGLKARTRRLYLFIIK